MVASSGLQIPPPLYVKPPGVWTKRWHRLKHATPVLKSLATIFLLFGLDIRDALYKLIWVGPSDSYHFAMGSTVHLHSSQVIPPATATGNVTMASGWPSFLSRCDSITPFCSPGNTFFLSALLSNCRLNGDSETNMTKVASSFVVIADTRADAVAWASCSLLFVARRPPICQERIVAFFNHRYVFSATDIPVGWMAPVGSTAEKELLDVLDVLSFAVPLHGVTCAEGFAVDTTTLGDGAADELKYVPNVYICGSPSQHRSAFVGVEHPGVQRLLRDKAWLTMDIIQWMNIRWGIRQNTHSYFIMGSTNESNLSSKGLEPTSPSVHLTTHTTANFSSFGQLYVILAVIDISLLLLHFFSSLEVLAWVLYPTARHFRNLRVIQRLALIRERLSSRESDSNSRLNLRRSSLGSVSKDQLAVSPRQLSAGVNFREHATTGTTLVNEELLNEDFFYSFFSRSLYRNPRVVAATCISQLLSWQIIQPNSVVWTWSDSFSQKLQAYMSSIRVWVLLLLLVNGLWGLFVAAQEERAYRIARLTYLTSVEILAIVTVVSFMMRNQIFSMCEIKWTLERQRLYDFTSFPGFLAHSNSFNLGLDSVVITPTEVLLVQYGPLICIIGTSFGVLLLYSALKTAYLVHYDRVAAWISQKRRTRRGPSVVTATSMLKSSSSMQDLLDSTGSARQQSQQHQPRYERSELEVLLNCPVRAKSIIRNSMELEKTNSHGLPEATPSCALDFGVMVRDGEAHSRICFWGVFTKKHKRISLQADGESPTVRSRRRSSVALSMPRSSFNLLSSSVTPLDLSLEGPQISGTRVFDVEKPRKRRSIEQ